MENPIGVGLLIFAAWFFGLWGLSSALVDRFGVVEKYAFPCAMFVMTVPAIIAVLTLYGQTEAIWVTGGAVFVNVCIRISGGQ